MTIKRVINRHDMSQTLVLADFVKAKYAEVKKTDVDFAALATEELKFFVNDNHIHAIRNALGIPSTKEVLKAEKPETIIDRIAACERAIGNLIRRMDAWEK
jgi:uncharacterized protein YlzI (FlbEa/FlbD family)